jgi:hypothetical protein
MLLQNKILVVGCIASCICQPYCHALKVGNATAVYTVNTNILFPKSDSDNSMFGFAHFAHGFTLEDETTSCTFSSLFPVSGLIDMNGVLCIWNKTCLLLLKHK